MSSTILELMRLNHELSERAELAFGEELDIKPNGSLTLSFLSLYLISHPMPLSICLSASLYLSVLSAILCYAMLCYDPLQQKAKVWQQHHLHNLTNQILHYNQELSHQYQDEDGLLSEEIQHVRDGGLASFDEVLKTTLEYYENNFPSGLEALPSQLPSLPIDIEFSGEEIFGKYLDLHRYYLLFVNMMKKSNSGNGSGSKQGGGVGSGDYLFDFHYRIQPLINLNEDIVEEWKKEFAEKVKNGEIVIKGKVTAEQQQQGVAHAPQPLRLGMFNDVTELEALGMDRLKEALEALGLKCGGTLQDRARRLWSIRGKKAEEIPSSLKSKTHKQQQLLLQQDATSSGSNGNGNGQSVAEEVAWKEFQITSLCEIMGDLIRATRRHAEKQQARSVEEKQQEIMEEEYGLLPDHDNNENHHRHGEEDDDDEAPIYNPLNLPLGWDGKPIPYWLYKLHGLGVEYKCEICGNQSYWGRKAFDRHFQEWKHAHGMRCLGVPNTKHFHDITKIEDVMALYAKIKDQLRKEQYLADFEEEFEDTQGNVLNKRTYEDLARQGLL
eukprot:scaffold1462_cov168-Ochromonas_danica.AAC.4